MPVRRSRYVHLTRLGGGRVLAVHAMRQLRLTLDDQVAAILDWFGQAREMPEEMAELPRRDAFDPETLARALASLMQQGLLTELDPEAEDAAFAAELQSLHGRDPGEALDALRRRHKQGADAYWSVTARTGLADLGAPPSTRLRVLLFGDCDLQMEADFLARDAQGRGVTLEVATSFPDDARLAADREHDALIVGALRSRRLLADRQVAAGEAIDLYLAEARGVIAALRAASSRPILLDGLPEPTVQPLGMAEAGPDGHRNRFRRANLELARLAAELPGVHLVDVAAAFAAHGAARLLDDGLVGFHHFGSPGWMLQRPEREAAAVHGIVPDAAPLLDAVGGDLYARERIAARAHMNVLASLFALDRKKCVIVDLDGTLWPGVLAETGAPFAWTPEVSGPYSHIGLWFGLHEALKALKARGVLLACVSKNDEEVVRDLWRYPDGYPRERLLTPDDFVTWRVNWKDKAENIASIAAELGFATSAFLFIDDHPVERDRVRQALPEVEVWGEDPWGLRRRLLEDPRLQTASLTAEAGARTNLVKAQLGRDRARVEAGDGFLSRLQLVVEAGAADAEAPFARIAELFERTTQFNTTGRRFGVAELQRMAAQGRLHTARASDRFGDYGLVAAAVTDGGEIEAFVMSCRVIGLGVERALMDQVLAALSAAGVDEVEARILETDRNGPVRNLYADAGFRRDGDTWRRTLAA